MQRDPSGVGTVHVRRRRLVRPPRAVSVRRFVVSCAFLMTSAGALVYLGLVSQWPMAGGFAVGLGVYLLAAHYVHPEPNHDHLGWRGTLYGDPNRFTDEANWLLSFLFVGLLPG